MLKMTKLNKEEVIKLHVESGKTVPEIAAIYGVSYQAIWNSLKKTNTKHSQTYGKRYECNDSFFNTLTNTSSYVLGLLYADGCIQKNKMELALSDEQLINDVKNIMFYTGPIGVLKLSETNKKHKDSYRLCITSETLVSSLRSLGCIPKKSLILQWPGIPELKYPDFIRGYFDGDGCISTSWKYQEGRIPILRSYVSFVGTAHFVSGLQQYLTKFDITSTIKIKGNVQELHINGNNNLQKLFSLMYTAPAIKLERKYAHWLQHKEYLNLRNELPELFNGSVPLNNRLYPYFNNLTQEQFKKLIADYLNNF